MLGGWWLFWGLLATLGIPLAVVRAILWLCERSWQKPAGSMGSLWAFGAAIVLCLPLAIYLGPALTDYLFR